MSKINPKDFWEKKILTWESSRYGSKDQGSNILEWFAGRASRSLLFRRKMALVLLTPHVKNKTILEVGCGSASLAQSFIDAGASFYHGSDITDASILAARQQAADENWSDRIRLSTGDATLLEISEDIILSLGVLDWLNQSQVNALFEHQGSNDFLHSFSEYRASPTQYLHRTYVYCAYGHKTGSYVPRYYRAQDLVNVASKIHPGPFYIFRHPQMSFGAFFSTLPVGDKIQTC